MRLKAGVQAVAAHPSVLHAMDVVDAWWRREFEHEPTVTSVHDSKHSDTSLHFGIAGDTRSRAFDLRTREITRAQADHAQVEITKLLGDAFDVVLEKDHFHIELDIKHMLVPKLTR